MPGEETTRLKLVNVVTKATHTYSDGSILVETPAKGQPQMNKELRLPAGSLALLSLLVFLQVIFVTMVYGPIAAFLVELFPARIRYTSLSLPYHIGNGVFGGLTPFIATATVASTGNPFAGLIYPIAVALVTFVVGGIFIKKRNVEEA